MNPRILRTMLWVRYCIKVLSRSRVMSGTVYVLKRTYIKEMKFTVSTAIELMQEFSGDSATWKSQFEEYKALIHKTFKFMFV